MADRHQDYITTVRQLNRQIWDGINELVGLQREWNALDYAGGADPENELSDGTGDNAGVTADEVGAVVFATTDALVSLLNTGHATNMARLL
jgi:hypothetical protein